MRHLEPTGQPHQHADTYPGIKAKVENQAQYDEYLTELESLRKELGIELREAMYPESS